MVLLLVEWLAAAWPALVDAHALERITLRAALAAVATFLLAILCGPAMIGWLKGRFREAVKSGSPQVARLHASKNATPTMGGIFIVGGLVAGAAVFADWANPYLPIVILLAVALCGVGACDDWIKLATSRRGLSARAKLAAQAAVALLAATLVYRLHAADPEPLTLWLPFSGTWEPSSGLQPAASSLFTALWLPFAGHWEPGWFFVPLAALVIVGSSNAVNLADGLDGLAGGCLLCAIGAMGLVCYAGGHAEWAAYLGIAHIAGAGEMAVVAAATIGGLLAFLWFNCHPASVFMGDAGSLPLGGVLGLLAVIARQELLLVVIGGVFVAEAASVIVQVGWFRTTGRRVFLCAPLHHHFQLRGWPEDKIVVRFWISAMLCAVVGLAGLKLQAGEFATVPEGARGGHLTRGGNGTQESPAEAELLEADPCPENNRPAHGVQGRYAKRAAAADSLK